MDVMGSGTDSSRDPKFLEPKAGRIFYGPVYCRKESEPYMTIALGGGPSAGVTVAEVNLKFIWDVVSQIKIGKAGHAYVVDSRGQLIAHPDISLVLQKTDLSALPQVQQARAAPAAVAETATIAHDRERRPGLAAFATKFNSTTAQLRESYATLERKVEERTRELSESLEQQTATAEILRVISQSQADVQPVFDAIVRSAVRLCDALFCVAYRFDGELIHPTAHHSMTPEALDLLRRMWPAPPSRETVTARSILERSIIHVADVAEEGVSATSVAFGHTLGGYHTMLAVPMLRDGVPIGTITLARHERRPFSEKQVEAIKTFADQAVIAIENARLFTELQERTRDLARSVDELKALGEVGRAVSSTLDLETVLATIVSRANQLSGTDAGAIFEYDEATELFHLRATQNFPDDVVEALRATPLRIGEGAVGRLATTREPIQIPDITVEGPYRSRRPEALLRTGYRALLAGPMRGEDHIIGGLVVDPPAPGEVAEEVVELLKTFATQSALALQNARLFQEIAEKSRQLEVADRHKSEFLANVSHELRTPLNAIIGFSEVLIERMFGDLNEKQDEYLKDIFASGRHLLSLINDILDLSKIEAGKMELELTRFDLPAAIDNALTLVKGRAANHGITLTPDVDRRLGEFVADERKLKQVLVNLLSNAVKFTPEGGRVEVQAARAVGGVEISVGDTGIGIAAEDQELIFEEFRQVGSDYARKREGTGLGLALTKRLVELHGGRIWVKSELGN